LVTSYSFFLLNDAYSIHSNMLENVGELLVSGTLVDSAQIVRGNERNWGLLLVSNLK